MKIFLAGNDSGAYALVLHALGYPYRLASYYQVNDPSHAVFECSRQAPQVEWIMDSGLFSLMFGAGKGLLKGYDAYEAYAKKYVADMKAWGWQHAIVECDVQRVLGVAETHRLRDEVFRPSGLETIYVWHIPEGEEGLTELARRERRVALSVPEFRSVLGNGRISGGGVAHAAIMRGLRLIREAKRADQRVHLLGNTERGLVEAPRPADTCDSTSWMSGGRFGQGITFDPKVGAVASIAIFSPRWKAWSGWCEEAFKPSFDLIRDRFGAGSKQWVYYRNAACSAIAYVLWMERLNGKVDLVVPASLPTLGKS